MAVLCREPNGISRLQWIWILGRGMARYKHIDTSPRFLAVDLERQLLPGTFEHALHHLIEHELDLFAFDCRYRNDRTGAPAYPPGLLLKVVLFAYSRGDSLINMYQNPHMLDTRISPAQYPLY